MSATKHIRGFHRDAEAIYHEPKDPRWLGAYGYATCTCGWRSPLTIGEYYRAKAHGQHVVDETEPAPEQLEDDPVVALAEVMAKADVDWFPGNWDTHTPIVRAEAIANRERAAAAALAWMRERYVSRAAHEKLVAAFDALEAHGGAS